MNYMKTSFRYNREAGVLISGSSSDAQQVFGWLQATYDIDWSQAVALQPDQTYNSTDWDIIKDTYGHLCDNALGRRVMGGG